jgi:hypothetical protein
MFSRIFPAECIISSIKEVGKQVLKNLEIDVVALII